MKKDFIQIRAWCVKKKNTLFVFLSLGKNIVKVFRVKRTLNIVLGMKKVFEKKVFLKF